MKLYIAASSRTRAVEITQLLETAGHECTSTWVYKDQKFHMGVGAYSDAEREALAVLDEDDVRRAADGLVLIAEERGKMVPGGKHVETGIALALGRRVFVVGERENIFHWHPLVTTFADEGTLVSYLSGSHGNEAE